MEFLQDLPLEVLLKELILPLTFDTSFLLPRKTRGPRLGSSSPIGKICNKKAIAQGTMAFKIKLTLNYLVAESTNVNSTSSYIVLSPRSSKKEPEP